MSDCEAMGDYIMGSRQTPEKHLSTVLKINELLVKFEDFEVMHVHRERNGAADWLAGKASWDGGLSGLELEDEDCEACRKLVDCPMAQEPCFPICDQSLIYLFSVTVQPGLRRPSGMGLIPSFHFLLLSTFYVTLY